MRQRPSILSVTIGLLLAVFTLLPAAVNVKTVGGVPIANVKTVGGVARASVKTIGGVDNTSGGGGGTITFPLTPVEGDFSITQSPVVNYPSSLEANDIIYVVFTSGAHDSSGTPPTGFTKLDEEDAAGTSTSIFWKRSAGGETSDTWTTIFAAAELGVYVTFAARGAEVTGDPHDATTVATNSGSTTAKDQAITTVTANAMVIGVFGFQNATASAYTVAQDGSQTEHIGDSTTPDGFVDAGNHQITVAFLQNDTADSQNIGIDLGTATTSADWAIALKPE